MLLLLERLLLLELLRVLLERLLLHLLRDLLLLHLLRMDRLLQLLRMLLLRDLLLLGLLQLLKLLGVVGVDRLRRLRRRRDGRLGRQNGLLGGRGGDEALGLVPEGLGRGALLPLGVELPKVFLVEPVVMHVRALLLRVRAARLVQGDKPVADATRHSEMLLTPNAILDLILLLSLALPVRKRGTTRLRDNRTAVRPQLPRRRVRCFHHLSTSAVRQRMLNL